MPGRGGVFASLLRELRAEAAEALVPSARFGSVGRAGHSRTSGRECVEGDASLDERGPREESLETKCVRPSLRFLAHVELVVLRSMREPTAFEVHERDPRDTSEGLPSGSQGARGVEIARVRVLKPAATLAHLQALDGALVPFER